MTKKIISLLLVVCMSMMLLPVFASAEGGSMTLVMKSIDGKGNVYPETKEGQQPWYGINTDDGSVIREGAGPDNYNVKLEYPEGGVPTLYLKNAYINSPGGNAIYRHPNYAANSLKVVVESDSTINAGWQAISIEDGDLTITGPGKLTCTTIGAGLQAITKNVVSNLIIDNATIEIMASKAYPALRCTGGDITITNSQLKLTGAIGHAIDTQKFLTQGAEDSLIEYKIEGWENRANVIINSGTIDATGAATTMASGNGGGCGIMSAGNVVINGGTVNLTGGNRAILSEGKISITGGTVTLAGKHFTRQTVDVGEENGFNITGGTVEIFGMKSVFTDFAIPNFEGHPGYSAVGGANATAAVKFNPANATKYKYFKLTDGDTIPGQEETTEATEETTEATQNTTEETQNNNTTENNNATENNQGNNATENNQGNNATQNNQGNNNTGNTGNEGGDSTLLIAIVIIVVGVAAAAAIVIVKNKKAA